MYLVPYVVQVRHLLGMYLVITENLLYLVPYLLPVTYLMHSTYWGHFKYTPGIYPMELRMPGMHLVHADCIRYRYQKLGTNRVMQFPYLQSYHKEAYQINLKMIEAPGPVKSEVSDEQMR